MGPGLVPGSKLAADALLRRRRRQDDRGAGRRHHHLLPPDPAGEGHVAVGERARRVGARDPLGAKDDLQAQRLQPAHAGRKGDRMLDRDHAQPLAVHHELELAGDPARRCRGVSLGRTHCLALAEGRDLRHVEDVENVDPVARRLDAAVVVDREVAERMRVRDGGSREHGEHDQQADQASHAASLSARGAQRSEKVGFAASARANQGRATASPWRQRSIMPL